MVDFLKFGFPMIPHQLGGWIRSNGDKVLLLSLIGTGTTGLFVVGQQIGMIMSIVMASVNKAIYPILFRNLNRGLEWSDKMKIVKITYISYIFIIFFGLILIVLLEYLYPYVVGENFQNSLYLSQLIIIVFIFEGMYYTVVNYIFFYKKTASLAKITFAVSMLHLIFSYLSIKSYGMVGVVYVLILSSFLQFILVWRLSNKIFPMPWFSFFKKEKNVT
jgi:O-antigen/teichoic acid export membrane protein